MAEKQKVRSVHEVDVRGDPPARRHELIFEAFRALSPGEGFVLVNDHDPKPLYYQFAAEYPGGFDWESRDEGPDVWRVYIGSPIAGRPSVRVGLLELQGLATMVIEGLRVRGYDTVTLENAEAIAAWFRLQATWRDGRVRHAEPSDLAFVLDAVGKAADRSREVHHGDTR